MPAGGSQFSAGQLDEASVGGFGRPCEYVPGAELSGQDESGNTVAEIVDADHSAKPHSIPTQSRRQAVTDDQGREMHRHAIVDGANGSAAVLFASRTAHDSGHLRKSTWLVAPLHCQGGGPGGLKPRSARQCRRIQMYYKPNLEQNLSSNVDLLQA